MKEIRNFLLVFLSLFFLLLFVSTRAADRDNGGVQRGVSRHVHQGTRINLPQCVVCIKGGKSHISPLLVSLS